MGHPRSALRYTRRLLTAAGLVALAPLAAGCRSEADTAGDSGGPATTDGGAGSGTGSAASNAQFEAQRPRADTLPDGRPANGTADTPDERGVSRP